MNPLESPGVARQTNLHDLGSTPHGTAEPTPALGHTGPGALGQNGGVDRGPSGLGHTGGGHSGPDALGLNGDGDSRSASVGHAGLSLWTELALAKSSMELSLARALLESALQQSKVEGWEAPRRRFVVGRAAAQLDELTRRRSFNGASFRRQTSDYANYTRAFTMPSVPTASGAAVSEERLLRLDEYQRQLSFIERQLSEFSGEKEEVEPDLPEAKPEPNAAPRSPSHPWQFGVKLSPGGLQEAYGGQSAFGFRGRNPLGSGLGSGWFNNTTRVWFGSHGFVAKLVIVNAVLLFC